MVSQVEFLDRSHLSYREIVLFWGARSVASITWVPPFSAAVRER